jgi:hypothetical protein
MSEKQQVPPRPQAGAPKGVHAVAGSTESTLSLAASFEGLAFDDEPQARRLMPTGIPSKDLKKLNEHLPTSARLSHRVRGDRCCVAAPVTPEMAKLLAGAESQRCEDTR